MLCFDVSSAGVYVQANCRRGYSSEVQSVGDYGTHNGDPKTLEECMALCDETADCKSFVVDQMGGLKCHLKNECVDEDSPCIDAGWWNFIHYYTENLCGAMPNSHFIAQGNTNWEGFVKDLFIR